jgi:hypothetical protein
LLRSESRLKTLVLEVVTSSLLRRLYGISPGFFDRLETLTIIFDGDITQLPDTLPTFEATNKLREFTLTPSRRPMVETHFADWPGLDNWLIQTFSPEQFLLPWAQLTSLHLGDVFALSSYHAHKMLRQCDSLVSCEISVSENPDATSGPYFVSKPSSPTMLPNLRRLQLTIITSYNSWLQDLALPRLTKLELKWMITDSDSYSMDSWSDDLCPFIATLQNLESLKFITDYADSTFPSIGAERVLQSAPMITSLALLYSISRLIEHRS